MNALTGMAQWVERHPRKQKFSGLILVREHVWVVGLSLVRASVSGNESVFLSLLFSLPSLLSKNK